MGTLIYKGFINEHDYGENDYALFIGDKYNFPIVQELEEEINEKQVSVRYWVSDKEKTKDELQESFLRKLFGDVEICYNDIYSEYTGYLWTNEDLNIGGHDLLSELRGHIGKFIYLEIDVY